MQPVNRSHRLGQLCQACSRRWGGDRWGSGLLPLCAINHCVVCHGAGEGTLCSFAVTHLHQSNQGGPQRLRRWMRDKCQPGCIPFSYPANYWLGSDNSCVFVNVSEIWNLLLEQKINLGLICSPERPQTPHYLKGKSLKRLTARCCRFSYYCMAASMLLLLQPS